MVICKYYQQGNCRYGNNCRFDHLTADYSRSVDSGFRGRFSGHHYQSNSYYPTHNKHSGLYKVTNSSHEIEEVMKMIVQEVLQSEKGGQWPLSCFAPIKERQCFPGWEDHSQEEIRWKMYEALKSGTLPECQRQIKELYEAAKIRRNSILHPNDEVYKIVDKIIHGQKLETETSFSFVQTANQNKQFGLWNSPAFGTNQQQSTVPSSFTFTLPQFGGPVNQVAVQPSPSVFGAPVQPMQSMHNVSNQMQSVPNQMSSVTNQMSSVSNQMSSVSNQMSSVSNQMSSVTNQMPSVFSSPSQVQNSSPCGNVTQDFSGFQQPAQPQVSAASTNPMFGVNNSIFNTNAAVPNKPESNPIDSSLYSVKTDLTNDELNAFIAQTFTMGKVPTKPPPRELCCV